MRRGLEIYCGSLTGDLKRGRAAAPFLVALRYPPSGCGTEPRVVTVWVCATGRLGRRDGRDAQSTGRPTGRPFFCPQDLGGRSVGTRTSVTPTASTSASVE